MTQKVGEIYYDVTLETGGMVDGQRKVRRELDETGGVLDRFTTKLTEGARAASEFVAAIYAIQKYQEITKALYEASVAAERLKIGLDFATGGNGARELIYVSDLSNKLGLSLQSTASAYMGFAAAAKGTALEGAATRTVFEAVSKAASVMGLSAEQSSGALLALQQMVSKGTVQAEELRGQLGERLPGAFQIAARAMGVTTQELGELLEQGKVLADDFLPKFAAQLEKDIGGAAEKAADRLGAALARMEGAWFRFKQTAGDSGISKSMDAEYAALARELTALSDAMEGTRKAGGGMAAELATGLGVAAGRIGFSTLNLLANTLNGTINLLTGSAFELNTNMALLPDAFKTSAQQAAAMAQDLKQAEAEFVRLKAQSDQYGSNIYFKSELAVLSQYIAKLKEATAAKADLTGIDPRNIDPGQTRGASYARWDAEQAKAALDLTHARMKAQGVNKEYFETLQVYQKGLKNGLMTEKEYVAAVSDLAKKTYDGSTTGKDAKKDAKDGAAGAKRDAMLEGKGFAAKAYYEGLVADNKNALDKINAEEQKALFENQKRRAGDAANSGIYEKAKVEIGKKFAVERLLLAKKTADEIALVEDRNMQANAEARILMTISSEQRIWIIRDEAMRQAEAGYKRGQLTFEEAETAKTRAIQAAIDQQKALQLNRQSIQLGTLQIKASGGGAQDQENYVQAKAAADMATVELERLKDLENSQIYADQKVAIEAKMHQDIEALRINANQAAMSSTSDIFGSLVSITKSAAGEQSAAYKVAFAAQKAYSIASAIVAIQTGISLAASQPWPLNLAAMASVAAATAGIVATISGTNISGGRQYGGPANSGNLYRVNEKGAPEMFTAGNGQQYMMPTQSGRVTAADQVGGGNQPWVINIHNAPEGTTASVDQSARIIEVAVGRAVAEVSGQFAANSGSAWSALRGASNVQGRMG